MKTLFFALAALLLLAGSSQASLNPAEVAVVEQLLGAWPVLSTYGWVVGSAEDACGPPVPWGGITCDSENSTITGIWLTNIALNAAIPDAIGQLTNLTSLQIEQCSLTGPIPTSLSGLTELAVLNLGWNQLSGTVPTALVALTHHHLSTFILNNNQLELCGNPSLNDTSIAPGILQCNVSSQTPEPCGCPGIWTHCLDSDITECSAPVVPQAAVPQETSVPESGVPEVQVPEVITPQVIAVPDSVPTVIITPQSEIPITFEPTFAPSTPTEAPAITPTSNAPSAASTTSYSVPLMIIATLAALSAFF